MANYFNSQIEAELRKQIGAVRSERLNWLADGTAEDYAAYKERVGYLRALKDVEDWLADIDARLSKG